MNALTLAARRLRRRPVSTAFVALVVGATLATAGLVGTGLSAVRGIAGSAGRAAQVIAYLDAGSAAEAWTKAERAVRALPGIAAVRLLTPGALLGEIREATTDAPDLLEGVGEDLLPAALEITPTGDPSLLTARLAEIPGVAEVRGMGLGSAPLQRLTKLLAVASVAGWSLLLLLGLSAGSLVAGVTGLQAMAARDETELMRLFGASEGTVRLPLIVEGALVGALGSVLAAAAVVATMASGRAAVGGPEPGLAGIPLALPPGWTWALFLAAGPLLGALGASVAVGRVRVPGANFLRLLPLVAIPGWVLMAQAAVPSGPMARILSVDQQIADLDGRRIELVRTKDQLEVALAGAAEQLADLRAEGRAAAERRVGRLRALHRLGRAYPAAAFVGPAAASWMHRRRLALETVLRHDLGVAAAHRARSADLEESTEAARVVQAKLSELATTISGVIADMDGQRKLRADHGRRLAADSGAAALATREADQSAGQVGEIAASTASPPKARARPKGSVEAGFSSSRRLLPSPVQGVSAPEARRAKRRPGTIEPKGGIDIDAAAGSQVMAVWPGTVAHVGWLPAYGRLVIVRHDGPWHTVYGHLADVAVTVGSAVGAGHVLGAVGATGSGNQPRVHFEVRHGAESRDPRPWLARR